MNGSNTLSNSMGGSLRVDYPNRYTEEYQTWTGGYLGRADHKGFIDIEEFGIPENYLYYGGLGVILLGIIPAFFIRRCPGCGAYLGRKANPVRCNSCEAEFR